MATNPEDDFKKHAKTTFRIFILIMFIFVLIKCIIDYYYIQSYKSDFGILIVFSLFLFFYIFVNNLVLTKNKIICGSKNQNIAFFSTLFPFVFIYVIGVVMITILPGWVRSFSNTFGLSVAKLCGMTTLTDYLFSNENKTSTINKKEGDYEFRKMVEKVYEDPDTILNELSLDDIRFDKDNPNEIESWVTFDSIIANYVPDLKEEKTLNDSQEGNSGDSSQQGNGGLVGQAKREAQHNLELRTKARTNKQKGSNPIGGSDEVEQDSLNNIKINDIKKGFVGLINIKNTVGKYLWVFIFSSFTILVSQNNLLSENCSKGAEEDSEYKNYLADKLSSSD